MSLDTDQEARPSGSSKSSKALSAPRRAAAITLRDALSIILHAEATYCFLVAAILAVLSWPVVQLSPGVGLDHSWQAGLAMATRHHFEYGPQYLFTYGPLGFLTTDTIFYSSTGILAFLFGLAEAVAVFAVLLWSLRRSFSPTIALVASYVVGTLALALPEETEAFIGISFIVLMALVREEIRDGAELVALFALGAVAGVLMLIKFSVGSALVAMVAVALFRTSAARTSRVLASAGGFMLTFVCGWLATGNAITNIPNYIRGSIAGASAYSSAMSLELRTPDYWLAAVVLGITAVLLFSEARRLEVRQQLIMALITLIAVFVVFKEGFARNDGHDILYAGAMLLILAGLRAPAARRPHLLGGLALTSIVFIQFAGGVPPTVLRPVSAAQRFSEQLRTEASGTGRSTTMAKARETMRATYDLDPATLALVRGKTTAIFPWEDAAAWAYPEMIWDPMPVSQVYGAYSTYLDELDVRFLSSERAPQRILEQPAEAIDGRVPSFEPPATWIAVMCHYRVVHTTNSWQVLARTTNRCGSPHLLGTVGARTGEYIKVPTRGVGGGEAVIAVIDHQPESLLEPLENLALKPPSTFIQTDHGASTYRFVTGTEKDWHLMRPSLTLGYARPFAPVSISNFAITGGGVGRGTGGLEVSFYAMQVSDGTSS